MKKKELSKIVEDVVTLLEKYPSTEQQLFITDVILENLKEIHSEYTAFLKGKYIQHY